MVDKRMIRYWKLESRFDKIDSHKFLRQLGEQFSTFVICTRKYYNSNDIYWEKYNFVVKKFFFFSLKKGRK